MWFFLTPKQTKFFKKICWLSYGSEEVKKRFGLRCKNSLKMRTKSKIPLSMNLHFKKNYARNLNLNVIWSRNVSWWNIKRLKKPRKLNIKHKIEPGISELELLRVVFSSKMIVRGLCFATGYFQRILKGNFGLYVSSCSKVVN